MVVDQNSFIRERPFCANKKCSFANLSRIPCLSFAKHMLSNNSSYEDSFITCQITKLSRITSSHPCKHAASITESPSQDKLLLIRQFFANSFAELSRNFRENTPIRRPQPSAGGTSEEKQTPGALVFGSRKVSLLEAWLLHLVFVS